MSVSSLPNLAQPTAKTIERWPRSWNNASEHARKFEKMEMERRAQEERERAYWAKAKAQAAENWKRIMANQQQRVPDVSDRVVVVRSGLEEMVGVITVKNDDGTYEVKAASGTELHAIVRSDIAFIPSVLETPCLGARVLVKTGDNSVVGFVTSVTGQARYGVISDQGTFEAVSEDVTLLNNEQLFVGAKVKVTFDDKGPYYGVLVGINDDGTCAVTFPGGKTYPNLPRNFLSLDHGSTFAVGDRVGVKFPKETQMFYGSIVAVNPDATYAVKYDGGTVHKSIPHNMLTPEPVYEPLAEGDRVSVRFPGKQGVYYGKLLNKNPDGTFAIKYDGGSVHQTIARQWITKEEDKPKDVVIHTQPSADAMQVDKGVGNTSQPLTGKKMPATTLDRWAWKNVSVERSKLEEAELKRQADEREARRFIESQYRKWNKATDVQRHATTEVVQTGQHVIIKGTTPEEPLHMGIVTGVQSADTYFVKYSTSDEPVAIQRCDIFLSPAVNESLFPGALVGVRFPQKPNQIFNGVVEKCNPDGTFQIKYDTGAVHTAVSRDMIACFYNESIGVGDRVIVQDKGKLFTGTILAVNKEGTFKVHYDSGATQDKVPRNLISLAPQGVSIYEGDLIKFSRGQTKESSECCAVVTKCNVGDSYEVQLIDTGEIQIIPKTDIRAYHNGVSYVSIISEAPASPLFARQLSSPTAQRAVISEPVADERKAAKRDPLDYSRTIQMMVKGAVFQQYLKNGKKDSFVFYTKTGESPCGTLWWNDPSPKEEEKYRQIPEQSMSLKSISDIYMGKKKDVFTSSLRNEANSKCCFTILNKNPTIGPLNFEAIDEQTRATWINGINMILTGTGKKVQVQYKHGYRPSEKMDLDGEIPIYPTLRPAKTLLKGVEPTKYVPSRQSGTLMRHATLSAYGPQDIKDMMAMGNIFTAYSVTPECIKDEIFLFYVKDSGPGNVGVLYWCDPSTRIASVENSLPLADISGVYLGKQSSVFRLPFAAKAVWNTCLSIISYDRKHDLHLEAPVAQQVSAWLEGINGILS